MKKDDTKTEVKPSLISEVRGEHRKIVWPSKEEQFKQTKIVIATSIILGFVIMSYDFAFKFFIDVLTQLFA